jgi:hypothetical protein
VDLYPNPTAPLVPLYFNSPVGGIMFSITNRSRQNPTCSAAAASFRSAASAAAAASADRQCWLPLRRRSRMH